MNAVLKNNFDCLRAADGSVVVPAGLWGSLLCTEPVSGNACAKPGARLSPWQKGYEGYKNNPVSASSRRFASRERTRYLKNRMSRDQFDLLKSIGFPFPSRSPLQVGKPTKAKSPSPAGKSKHVEEWALAYNAFKTIHGRRPVASINAPEGEFQLAYALSRFRSRYWAGKLPVHEEMVLRGSGFTFYMEER